jgi:hypothetical protein
MIASSIAATHHGVGQWRRIALKIRFSAAPQLAEYMYVFSTNGPDRPHLLTL